MITRRRFMAAGVAGWSGLALRRERTDRSFQATLCFFSKHLAENDWERLAENVKSLGFDGIDLTVRPGGHVLPEQTERDLPRAAAAIREAGLKLPMITTALLSGGEPAARPILSTAGRLKIPYLKPGYYKYKLADVRAELREVKGHFESLVALAKECGVQVGYHNHAHNVGAAIWDMAQIMDDLDANWAGYYFDPRHAVAEGGGSAWKVALNLVAPRIKMVAVKDFYWEKTSQGWREKNCPLGQGMVDWSYFFSTLAKAGFQGPVSLHIEYEIPGESASAREENTLEAARKDLQFLKKTMQAAYL